MPSEPRSLEHREQHRLLGLLPLTMEVLVTQNALRLDLSGVLAPLSRWVERAEIQDVRARDGIIMRPFGHWGLFAGLGVRIAVGLGRIYNFGHGRGVSIQLRDDRRLVIGTDDPERLASAIREHLAGSS